MKNTQYILYISISVSTFYIALFLSVPLYGLFLAWIILLYFIIDLFIALRMIYKNSLPTEKVKIFLSEEEYSCLQYCKEQNLNIPYLIGTGISIKNEVENMKITEDYRIIIIPESSFKDIENSS